MPGKKVEMVSFGSFSAMFIWNALLTMAFIDMLRWRCRSLQDRDPQQAAGFPRLRDCQSMMEEIKGANITFQMIDDGNENITSNLAKSEFLFFNCILSSNCMYVCIFCP